MNESEFIRIARAHGYKLSELADFETALTLIKPLLTSEKRLAGDTLFEHHLRVGIILIENKSSAAVVLAGLMHNSRKYQLQLSDLNHFELEVRNLVAGVNELEEIKSRSRQMAAENLRRVLLTAIKDIRVVFVKLADKLDNLRTLSFLPPLDQQRIAQEVLDIYAPLAYRLGAEKIRVELENLAFKILNPQQYHEIETFLAQTTEQRQKDIERALVLIKELAAGKIELLKIKGRPKNIYSIYKKMTLRKVPLQEQYDLLGLRVVVPEIKDCYHLLALLHQNFEPLAGRLKDYIANPKPNFYRSLHTAIKLPHGKIAEVQIRTPEMDEFAEEGLAAHWQYKGLKTDQLFEKKISWLRNVLELQENEATKEFLESAKVDVFGDKIYCYTPKGALKELPLGACVLDFAYAVHEDIGNQAIGGRINGKFESLKTALKWGDIVEIVTNKNQRPRRSWLKFVKTIKARNKIKKLVKELDLLPALHFHQFKSIIKEDSGVLVESEEFPKAVCLLAKCCLPLPGQRIVGIPTKRRVISVHCEDCRLALKEQERWVKVNWRETFNQKIKFHVRAQERSGLLADLLHTIATAGFEVKEAKAKMQDARDALCSFLVIPRSLEHLKELVKRVQKVKGVAKIYFE